MKRNWEAVALKALGGREFRFTVLDTERVGPHYQRVTVDGGGLLHNRQPHPTMWARLWFDNNGRPHQRAYTIVNPDPVADRFDLEFAIHDGPAARWSLHASPGDTIDATLQGSSFALPDPTPEHLYLVGDPASLPAVNSLLDAAEATPATVWLQQQHDADRDLPVNAKAHHEIRWLPHGDGTGSLAEAVRGEVPGTNDAFYWVTCEASVTRDIARYLRRTLGVDRRRIHALGYWTAS